MPCGIVEPNGSFRGVWTLTCGGDESFTGSGVVANQATSMCVWGRAGWVGVGRGTMGALTLGAVGSLIHGEAGAGAVGVARAVLAAQVGALGCHGGRQTAPKCQQQGGGG